MDMRKRSTKKKKTYTADSVFLFILFHCCLGLLILAHKVSDCVNGPKAEMRRAAARASEGLPAHSLEDVLTTGELAEMVAVKPLGSAAMLGLPDVVKGADVPAAGVGV